MEKYTQIKDIDVLVIGGGLAGTFAAIKAREAGATTVVQVDKSHVGKSGASCFAAGVMYVLFPQDDMELRLRRLARSMGYLAQQDLYQDHLEQGYPLTLEMERYGVQFTKSRAGDIERQQGRGSLPVIKFLGPQLMEAMGDAALKLGVRQLHRTMVTDLLTSGKRVVGAVGFDTERGQVTLLQAKAVVLATGGTFYKGLMPGHRDTSGDGYGAAYRAGAVVACDESDDAPANAMPAEYDIGPGMSMYVGEGARLLNARGERFMQKYNPVMKDRAGLLHITYAFSMEARQGNGPFYVDMTHFTPEQVQRLRGAVPLAIKMFERAGLIVKDRFVRPVEWGLMAPRARPGPMVNRRFETSLAGLFACGEAAPAQAVPGGLAAAATSGATAGRSAAEYARETQPASIDKAQAVELVDRLLQPLERKDGIEPDQVLLSLQETVVPYNVLFLRHASRMQKALEQVEDVRDNQLPLLCAYDPHYLRMAHEAQNLVMVAELQLRGALLRTESRVALREDYPYTDNIEWLKWVKARKGNGKMELFTEDVPIDSYPVKVKREKELNHLWQVVQQQGVITLNSKGQVEWVSGR